MTTDKDPFSPVVRQWLYVVAFIATALIPVLISLHVFTNEVGSTLLNFVGVLGGLGAGGAATAWVTVNKQRKEGTLDFTGTAAEQAVAAIQATVSQAATAATDLAKVQNAVTHAQTPAAPTTYINPEFPAYPTL